MVQIENARLESNLSHTPSRCKGLFSSDNAHHWICYLKKLSCLSMQEKHSRSASFILSVLFNKKLIVFVTLQNCLHFKTLLEFILPLIRGILLYFVTNGYNCLSQVIGIIMLIIDWTMLRKFDLEFLIVHVIQYWFLHCYFDSNF